MSFKNTIISGGEEISLFGRHFKSLGELLLQKLNDDGDSIKIINGKTGDKITSREIRDQSILIAKNLRKNGIKKNDRVAIVSENRFEYITITLGCIYIGATIVPINFTYKELELEHAFKLVDPKLIFVSNYAVKIVTNMAQTFEYDVINIDSDSFGKFLENPNVEEFLEKEIDLQSDVCSILFSSGTTGLAKGAQLTHLNYINSLESTSLLFISMHNRVNVKEYITFNISPFFHILGLMSAFVHLCVENKQLMFLARFEEEVYLKSIQEHKVNGLVVVPTIMVFLSKSPLVDKYDLSSLTEILCAGAAVSKELDSAFKNKINIRITQVYGMTETVGILIHTKNIEKPGSLGEVTGNVMAKVINKDGNLCGPLEPGEMYFKTKRNMKGYVGDSKATQEMIDQDGWLRTGDVGYFDEDYNFFMVERFKDLIKYNAFQVPPAEIEAILLMNPNIREAAVVGIPDEKAGELAMAFVVKQPNAELTEKEVVDFVAEKASKIKHLHGGVRFVEELPKSTAGKILRRKLRDMYKSF